MLAVGLIGIRVLMDIAAATAGTPGPRGLTGATGATGPQGMLLPSNTFIVLKIDLQYFMMFAFKNYNNILLFKIISSFSILTDGNLDCYYCHHIVCYMYITFYIQILMLIIFVNFRRSSN